MDEYTNVQQPSFQDTIAESAVEQTENIENDSENFVTPNEHDLSQEDILRDVETPLAQSSTLENTTASEPFITVQYNHKNRNFTKGEAINFIQKGMHTEALRAKLEYLANEQGTDVNTLVERIISAPENNYKSYLEQMYGKGSLEVEIGMDIYREKRSDEYKKIMDYSQKELVEAEKFQNTNLRLAQEYIDLKAQMPEAPDYSALPDSVIIEAADGKRDLYSAYLRYLYNENVKIDAAKKSQEAAATASSGIMGNNSVDNITSAERNFLSGLWGR